MATSSSKGTLPLELIFLQRNTSLVKSWHQTLEHERHFQGTARSSNDMREVGLDQEEYTLAFLTFAKWIPPSPPWEERSHKGPGTPKGQSGLM